MKTLLTMFKLKRFLHDVAATIILPYKHANFIAVLFIWQRDHEIRTL